MSESATAWKTVIDKLENSENIPVKSDALDIINNLLCHILIPPTMVMPYDDGYILEWHVKNNKMFEIEIDKRGSFESFVYGFYKKKD